MALDSEVWGPHYFFVLQTLAVSYPLRPNSVTKKKYYDLIQNVPLFIPDNDLGNEFSKFLDKYPVTPYLDSRESFMKWTYFIFNRINVKLGRDEVLMSKALNDYYQNYKPKEIILREEIKYREKLVYFGILTTVVVSIFYLYKK